MIPPEDVVFFEQKIRPLLAEECYSCHSDQAKKVKGGLKLDSRAAVLTGGESGPVLVVGKPQDSLLIKAVHRASDDLAMPPKKKLSDQQVADLEEWIRRGAPDPRSGASVVAVIDRLMEKGRTHWAFQPVSRSTPPSAGHPVDAFIRAHQNGQPSAPAADTRTLVRRLYFDLIGLPPTVEEVEAFSAAASHDRMAAIDALIECLLASPRYGEQWGRHWLDVVRYADTMGSSFGNQDAYPWAWSYRDWVIGAFNGDLSYDRFVQQQLAADLLPQPTGDNRALAALGFWTIGRRTSGSVDDNVYEDRIDVFARGLLGLTIGCARCHDHKLEPLRTKDYYALYHTLRSTREPDSNPELMPQADTPARRAFIALRADLARTHIRSVIVAAREALTAERGRVGTYLLAAHDAGWREVYQDAEIPKGILVPRNLQREIFDPLARERERWVTKQPALFAPWLAFAALKPEEWPTQAVVLARRFADNADGALNELVAQRFAGGPPANLTEVATRYDQLFATVWSDWLPTAVVELDALALPTADDQALAREASEKRLLQRQADYERTFTVGNAAVEEVRAALVVDWSPFALRPHELFERKLIDEETRKDLEKSGKAFTELENHADAPARAMALLEGSPQSGKVFVRGNPKTLGVDAPRRFIELLGGTDDKPFPKDASGRLQLAEAVTAAGNPLTARVIVNRVWQWHFGAGLVRTPSDFGLRGEAPTHPELLDWLTAWFIDNGWSMKKLHRLLLTSATWQQASVGDAALAARANDPDNRRWARMDAQPLGFERFRDQLLAVSGRLDLAIIGGRPFDVTATEAVRRSVYARIDRKALAGIFTAFDFPDPSFSAAVRGRTAQTVQALWLLNAPPLAAGVHGLTARARPDAAAPAEDGVRRLYRLVYQRDPSAAELARAVAFIANQPKDEVVLPEARDWSYGVVEYDAEAQLVRAFEPLPTIDGAVIRGRKLAHADASGVELTAKGGRTARQVALVRRWTAPLDGTVDVHGELVHTGKDPTGVTCRLVHSRSGQLGEWSAAAGHLMAERRGIRVARGDTLDFITINRTGDAGEAFTWAPTIVMIDREMPGMTGMPRRWDARSEFVDPAKLPPPIGAWESLAQVLLMANEAAWVD